MYTVSAQICANFHKAQHNVLNDPNVFKFEPTWRIHVMRRIGKRVMLLSPPPLSPSGSSRLRF